MICILVFEKRFNGIDTLVISKIEIYQRALYKSIDWKVNTNIKIINLNKVKNFLTVVFLKKLIKLFYDLILKLNDW